MMNCKNWNVYLTFRFFVFEYLYLYFIFVKLLNKEFYSEGAINYYPVLILIL